MSFFVSLDCFTCVVVSFVFRCVDVGGCVVCLVYITVCFMCRLLHFVTTCLQTTPTHNFLKGCVFLFTSFVSFANDIKNDINDISDTKNDINDINYTNDTKNDINERTTQRTT